VGKRTQAYRGKSGVAQATLKTINKPRTDPMLNQFAAEFRAALIEYNVTDLNKLRAY
jgi:hypothetical protein